MCVPTDINLTLQSYIMFKSDCVAILKYAALRCHPDLCRFLISHGAETALKYAAPATWELKNLGSLETQIDTMRLFLNDLDFTGDADLSSDGGLTNGWGVIETLYFSGSVGLTRWLLQNVPWEVNPHFVKDYFRLFLSWAIYRSDPQLHYVPFILGCANPHFREMVDMEGVRGTTPLFESILNRSSAPDLIREGANVHKLLYFDICHRSRVSVTWIAMLSSEMFYYWRHSLLNSGVCIEHFVKQECENNWIVEEGWTEVSLLRLFQLEFAPTHGSGGDCDRCHLWCVYKPGLLEVEVGWCVELERIKRNYVGLASSDGILTTSLELRDDEQAENTDETTGLFCPCVRQFTFVCPHCLLVLKATDHEHRDTYESEDSSSAGNDPDDLSDWEDSPFLPPLSA